MESVFVGSLQGACKDYFNAKITFLFVARIWITFGPTWIVWWWDEWSLTLCPLTTQRVIRVSPWTTSKLHGRRILVKQLVMLYVKLSMVSIRVLYPQFSPKEWANEFRNHNTFFITSNEMSNYLFSKKVIIFLKQCQEDASFGTERTPWAWRASDNGHW